MKVLRWQYVGLSDRPRPSLKYFVDARVDPGGGWCGYVTSKRLKELVCAEAGIDKQQKGERQ